MERMSHSIGVLEEPFVLSVYSLESRLKEPQLCLDEFYRARVQERPQLELDKFADITNMITPSRSSDYRWIPGGYERAWFLGVCLRKGLVRSFKAQLDDLVPMLETNFLPTLLLEIHLTDLFWMESSLQGQDQILNASRRTMDYSGMFRYLVKCGANPNHVSEGKTISTRILQDMLEQGDLTAEKKLRKILRALGLKNDSISGDEGIGDASIGYLAEDEPVQFSRCDGGDRSASFRKRVWESDISEDSTYMSESADQVGRAVLKRRRRPHVPMTKVPSFLKESKVLDPANHFLWDEVAAIEETTVQNPIFDKARPGISSSEAQRWRLRPSTGCLDPDAQPCRDL